MAKVAALILILVSSIAVASPTAAEEEETFWYGTDDAGEPTVRLYFFLSATCPHCRKAIPFVYELEAQNPWLEVVPLPLTDQRKLPGKAVFCVTG